MIHNLITSLAVPEMVTEAGGTPLRTRVGHSFIKAEMASSGAVFGGEHSAHYYFREFWGADTGMLAALHVLAAMQESDVPISQLAAGYERYAGSGEINSRVEDVPSAVARVRAAFDEPRQLRRPRRAHRHRSRPGGRDRPVWWFNLRGSNTEPLLRLNVEAVDVATMGSVRDEVLALVRQET